MYIHMAQFGGEFRGFGYEQPNGHLVITFDSEILSEMESNCSEKSLPLDDFLAAVRGRQQLGFCAGCRNSFLLCGLPCNWAAGEHQQEALARLSGVEVVRK